MVDVCDTCGRAMAAGPLDEHNVQLAIATLILTAGGAVKCTLCQGMNGEPTKSSTERFKKIVEADMRATNRTAVSQ